MISIKINNKKVFFHNLKNEDDINVLIKVAKRALKRENRCKEYGCDRKLCIFCDDAFNKYVKNGSQLKMKDMNGICYFCLLKHGKKSGVFNCVKLMNKLGKTRKNLLLNRNKNRSKIIKCIEIGINILEDTYVL